MGVSARSSDDGVEILKVTHEECEDLLEVTRRTRHPVFMDSEGSVFTGRRILQQAIQKVLDNLGHDFPVVGILAPEKLRYHEKLGEDTERDLAQRRTTLLREYKPVSPLDYPSTFFFNEQKGGIREEACTTLYLVRLKDLIPMDQVIRECTPNFLGLIPSQCAVVSAMRCVWEFRPPSPLTLCDIGKLRTLYSTILPDGRSVHHTIPVGLARDDSYYFKSIKPARNEINALADSVGQVFFPADSSPLPTTNAPINCPQIELTRLALQVSRYALRSLEFSLEAWKKGDAYSGAHFLTGMGSRVPGLRQYIEERTRTPLRRFDRRPIPGVILHEGVKWAETADAFLPFGACVAMLRKSVERPALLNLKESPRYFPERMCSVTKLEPRKLYVMEQGLQFT